MKAFFLLVALLGLCVAALFVPVSGRSFWARAQAHGIPAAVARGTAHGLRATWDFFATLPHRAQTAAGGPAREPPAHPPRHASRKAQAATAQPAHRASREGIVAQPPKEKLEETDRAALDALLTRPR